MFVNAYDFSSIQNYQVTTDDGKSSQYEVDMTYFTGLPIVYIETTNNEEIDSKDDYFTGSISRISGINLDTITKEALILVKN